MKANFKNLTVEVAFDEFKELDLAKQIGNYIHANTNDIGLDDVARVIYHSEGEVDIPDEYVPVILSMVENRQCLFLAAIKKAIINILNQS